MTNERKMQVWIGAGFLIVIGVITVIAALVSSGQQSVSTQFTPTTAAALTSEDWTQGEKSAKVVVLEYGDFQCPACGAYETIVKQLQTEYAGKILFVFRNFPLYQIHPNAEISAQAAEAAGLQGKYWEMHDLLYKNQAQWSNAARSDIVAKHFDGYAQSIGIDIDKFHTDINSDVVKNKIKKDAQSGNDAKINHTPTFFINMTQIPNPNSYAEFKLVIDAALASSTPQ